MRPQPSAFFFEQNTEKVDTSFAARRTLAYFYVTVLYCSLQFTALYQVKWKKKSTSAFGKNFHIVFANV